MLRRWLYIFSEGLVGKLLPTALLAVGVIYLIALKCFPLLHPVKSLKILFHGQKKEALRALSMALAGTLGVGNIAGVALSIAVGGAGSVFWMWVSAAVAMFLKYAEIVLAFLYRQKGKGGAMFYMQNGIGGRVGKIFACLFALACIPTALSLGSAVQASAAAESAGLVFRFPPWLSGALLCAFTFFATVGGVKGIQRVTSRLIPLLTFFYFFLSLYAVFSHAGMLPQVFYLIFKDAFSPLAAVGGVGGFLSSRAVRYGVTRGLLSNEAGAGTAPMAHATAENTPVSQGLLGMAEVFIDTFVLCSATAFAVLLAFPSGLPTEGGIFIVLSAFSSLVGRWTVIPLTVSVILFVYATVICWCFYGESALGYLTERRDARAVYLAFFHLFLFLGSVFSADAIWVFTDGTVSLMTLLNLAALLVLLPCVVKETRKTMAQVSSETLQKRSLTVTPRTFDKA